MHIRLKDNLGNCKNLQKFSFQNQEVHKIAKKNPCGTFFTIFDVKYLFNKRTVT